MSRKEWSAEVDLSLRTLSATISLAQVGSDFVVVRDSITEPPGPAVVQVVIDGRAYKSIVHLPRGVSRGIVPTEDMQGICERCAAECDVADMTVGLVCAECFEVCVKEEQ